MGDRGVWGGCACLALLLSACDSNRTVNNFYVVSDVMNGDMADSTDSADNPDIKGTLPGDTAETKQAEFVTVIGPLTWQIASSPQAYKWSEAKAFCENLTLETFSDWRLPTFEELEGIVDKTPSDCPYVLAPFRATTACGWYWSSTLDEGSPSKGWGVNFIDGGGLPPRVSMDIKSLGRVRCVR